MSFFHSDTINLTFRLTQTQKLTETETETETESATFIFRSVASIMREDYILAVSENNVSSSDNGAERRVDHYSIHTVYSCMQTTCYIPIHQSICQFVCVSVFWSVTPFLTSFFKYKQFSQYCSCPDAFLATFITALTHNYAFMQLWWLRVHPCFGEHFHLHPQVKAHPIFLLDFNFGFARIRVYLLQYT